ncbi:hypothetical protein PXK01_13320 [Phaeobacter sp. PT47_59]|nr:hypothetical protein [Phaeobacter sp. PT47_59]MDE4175138.1 hypothetical protein [Phaeobacter sp. PT47_59]
MKKPTHIMGHSAPSPRISKSAAVLFATLLSIPVFFLLTLADLLVF